MEKKGKKKSLCKLSKDEIRENLETIINLTRHPRFVCQKCARVSQQKGLICNPFEFAGKKAS